MLPFKEGGMPGHQGGEGNDAACNGWYNWGWKKAKQTARELGAMKILRVCERVLKMSDQLCISIKQEQNM